MSVSVQMLLNYAFRFSIFLIFFLLSFEMWMKSRQLSVWVYVKPRVSPYLWISELIIQRDWIWFFFVPSFNIAKDKWSALKNMPFGERTTCSKFEIWELVIMEWIISKYRILSLLIRCAHNLYMCLAWKSSEYVCLNMYAF